MDPRLEPTTALHPRSIALTNTQRHRSQPTVRAIQRGYLPFLGSGGQLLALLSSVSEVIAMLCVSRHAPASRPVCAFAHSLGLETGIWVDGVDVGGLNSPGHGFISGHGLMF
jgi:hypothetical protein